MEHKHILLIEKEIHLARGICFNLEEKGFLTDHALDGDTGLSKTLTTNYDLIVLAVSLPDKSGFDVCRELKNNFKTAQIPVVFLTSRGEDADRVKGLELGADDYIVKPFNLVEFLLRIDRFFRLKGKKVERFIEFPVELYQAGLGILNYFGSYLTQKYPSEEAIVKIEQCGFKIRLIIETKDGSIEIIEEALHEYGLIVSGQVHPAKFIKNEKLILELNNELRIAKFRIESQQDIISIQNNRIDKLMSILDNSLSNKQSISINFKPKINVTSNMHVNHDVSLALGSAGELKEILSTSSLACRSLVNLENSLRSIENENDPDIVRKSPAMKSFRRVLDKFTEEGTALKKAIDATETGWEIFKDLASKYNKIAEWCGLPQVPSIFTN